MTENEVIEFRLSAQRALWGAVSKSLRAFSGETTENKVRVRAVFDETVSDEDKELISAACSEIIADYVESFVIEEEYIVVPAGRPMKHLRLLIFLRHEPQ